MKCLHCGDCCRRMSPIENPCPNIISKRNFILCGQYERRPYECIHHTFVGMRFCPIGLDVLNLRDPEDLELIKKRIDEGMKMIENINALDGCMIELCTI